MLPLEALCIATPKGVGADAQNASFGDRDLIASFPTSVSNAQGTAEFHVFVRLFENFVVARSSDLDREPRPAVQVNVFHPMSDRVEVSFVLGEECEIADALLRAWRSSEWCAVAGGDEAVAKARARTEYFAKSLARAAKWGAGTSVPRPEA
jgi:hypothetical protein